MTDERIDASTDGTARWVFECTECGEIWVNPEAPVSGHFCDRHPKATGMPEGEPAEVECIKHPDTDHSDTSMEGSR